jgi:hypothetical protein
MKIHKSLLMLLLGLAVPAAQAAEKNFPVQYRQAIVDGDQLTHESRCQNYGFRVEIVSDNEGVKPETGRDGYPFITASKGENYSVRIYNPLPVRVAVNLTVDGLNSITGKPSGISDGEKWMIDPYSSITIPGWQVSEGEARRFFFTRKHKSYAQWRGSQLGEDLAANCGVVGAAYFWSQEELNQYYDDHPFYRYTQRPYIPYSSESAKSEKRAASASGGFNGMDYDAQAAAPAAPVPQQQAGTGMGQSESHPTYQVAFNYDRGMYSVDQALLIYYDFARAPRPNPFPALGYAPEMP